MTVTSAADGGVSVSVLVERPETLELIRRHSDLLLTDLKSEGFANPTLDFRQEGQAGNGKAHEAAPIFETTEAERMTDPSPDRRPDAARSLPAINGRTLDLRI